MFGSVKRQQRCRVYTVLAASVFVAMVFTGLQSHSGLAMPLRQAVKIALEANPEIGEAMANREAIEFELRKARGLYLPKIDLELRDGLQNFDSVGTRATGTDDDTLNRTEANIVVQQLLFDGFGRRNEVRRQAARVDGASHRVYERSEIIALGVIREYIETGLNERIVALTRVNLQFHRRILSDLKEGTLAAAISIADREQAQERLYATEARLTQTQEDLEGAKIRFFRLVGQPIGSFAWPSSIARSLPPNVNEALKAARLANPTIRAAASDLDAAHSRYKKSRADFLPKLSLEVTGRTGDNLEGVKSYENELKAELVLRWNLFRGGIDSANTQEQLRRVDEERFGLRRAHRNVEEAVRLSWNRLQQQRTRLLQLRNQSRTVDKLVVAYGEQFKVGDRSLLDLLDTQNTQLNAEVEVERAKNAVLFAEYRILAATGRLLTAIHLDAPTQSATYATQKVRRPATPDGETGRRYSPRR